MQTVLVVDSDRNFNQTLSKLVDSQDNCRMVANAYDGKSAIEQIAGKRPDIVIMDFILPKMDGLCVVEYIRHNMENYDPIVYVLSYFNSGVVLDSLNALQVDYFSLKPISYDLILRNLRIVTGQEQMRKKDIKLFPQGKPRKSTIQDLVMQFGVLPHRLSTKCIVDALLYYMENTDDMQVLSKALYPVIGNKLNITGYAVEKNIRSGIESMQKAAVPLFINFFPNAATKRVTNGEFLSTVAYYLEENTSYVDERVAVKAI